jgi:hypothetical protein
MRRGPPVFTWHTQTHDGRRKAMLKTRQLLVVALAGAIMLVGALPALAGGSLGATVTYKGKLAGDGTLVHHGGRNYTLIACDVLKDGFGVWAWAESDDGAFDTKEVRDTNGYNKRRSGTKGCGSKDITLSGDLPRLTVCLVDQDGNARGRGDCSEDAESD